MKTTGHFTLSDPPSINVRCPACRHVGSFSHVGLNDANSAVIEKSESGRYVPIGTRMFGIRVCPNTECNSVLFFARQSPGGAAVTFPPEVIDFDASNLPPGILASLEEAVKCHASGCYRASALMVRRTLEELCEDKKAVGSNLKARVAALSAVAIIPSELLNAADELRILGNDAAHIEAKDYDKIGEVEAELAIELAKELLKAVYQYTSLLSRLTALKKNRAT
ncbi:DUF4145 domain-containing protein [Mesorhizobium sp. M7D.F.Ca.US.005.01.1.1]|nr:DUF4145 domain-containing protein [Mesorhizobium sp. M7D.F.Ca.US.005.01.1.1]